MIKWIRTNRSMQSCLREARDNRLRALRASERERGRLGFRVESSAAQMVSPNELEQTSSSESWSARELTNARHARYHTVDHDHPAPYTLHPTPYTLHTPHYTLHPAPYTPHTTRWHTPFSSKVNLPRAIRFRVQIWSRNV